MRKFLQADSFPLPTRRIFGLIIKEANGNVSKFADMIGMAQQNINRLFNVDPRSGKYPEVSPRIKEAIITTFGVDEAWFYADDASPVSVSPSFPGLSAYGIDDNEQDKDFIIKVLLIRLEEKSKQLESLTNDLNEMTNINRRLIDLMGESIKRSKTK